MPLTRPVRSAVHVRRPADPPSADPRAVELVGGVRWIDVPGVVDERGEIAFLQRGGGLPFTPRRVYYLYDVPDARVRGEHAHRACHRVLVCVRGRVDLELDDGRRTAATVLGSPRRALHVPPMVWGSLSGFSDDAVLLVLASHDYDADDYIRDHDDFTATAVLASVTGGPR